MMIDQQVFSAPQAAEYLGITMTALRHHIYDSKELVPSGRIGNYLTFDKATLDSFRRDHQARGFTLHEAAKYLGVEVSWMRNHVYNTKRIVADGKRGKQAIFTRETLDAVRRVLLPQRQGEPQRSISQP